MWRLCRHELMGSIAAPFAVALALSLAFVPIARAIAARRGFVAKPREDRWHKRPVAMSGGIAIALSLFVCVLIFRVGREVAVLAGTAALMFAVGLVDDLISLKPATKLIAQIALASVLLFFDFRLNWLHSVTLDTVLTLCWVVGMTNAFNLLDNMDGLCGGITVIVGASLLIGLLPGASAQSFAQAHYLAMLLGAVGGFLVYNVHPASIFMGDSGALLIGFSLAAVTLSPEHATAGRSDVLSIVAVPLLVMLIPIFDSTLVTLSRWFSGRRASQGGRDHTSHRLVTIGLSERRAVALLWLLAAIGGGLGVGLDYFNQAWSAAAAVAFVLAMALFAVYLAGIRVYDEAEAGAREGAITPIVVEFMYKRRVAEVLLDCCLVAFCYYMAYRLRFETPEEFAANFDMFYRSFPIVMAAQMVAFFGVGIYRGVWRHFGLIDSLTVARGVFFGALGAQIVILYVIRYFQFFAYSRTVFAIYGVLLLIAITLSRASFRMAGEFVQRQRRSGTRVAIYGAGDGGGLVIRELLRHGSGDIRIIGFIDDDPRKAGIRVQGYPVLGGYSALNLLLNASAIDTVVISARDLPPERLHNLQTLCSDRGVGLSRLQIDLQSIVESELEGRAKPSRPAVVHRIGG
jgi:UDP-GlcNAc:undecaprenyl-phosphate GlcNAc-1-phosphate transferase